MALLQNSVAACCLRASDPGRRAGQKTNPSTYSSSIASISRGFVFSPFVWLFLGKPGVKSPNAADVSGLEIKKGLAASESQEDGYICLVVGRKPISTQSLTARLCQGIPTARSKIAWATSSQLPSSLAKAA